MKNRIQQEDVNIKEISCNEEMLRVYSIQLSQSPFRFSTELLSELQLQNITIMDINSDTLYDLIKEFLPNKFYYFDSIHIQKINLYLYTDIQDLSFEQGGLFVLQCFNIQAYRLCNNLGDIILDYCHDIELGPNGLVVWRSLENGNWAIGKYNKELKIVVLIDDINLEVDKFIGMGLRGIDKICLPQINTNQENVAYSENNFNEIEKQIINGVVDYNLIQQLLSDKSIKLWVTAPWLINYFKDINIAKIAVQRDYRAFLLLNEEIRHMQDIVSIFLHNAPFQLIAAISLFEMKILNIWHDIDLCVKWVGESELCFGLLPNNLKCNERILYEYAKYTDDFSSVPTSAFNDIALTKSILQINGRILKHLNAQMRNDTDIVIIAISNNGMAIEHASDRLKFNREIVMTAVSSNGFAIKFIPKLFWSDQEILSAAIRSTNGKVLEQYNWLMDDNRDTLDSITNSDSEDDLPF